MLKAADAFVCAGYRVRVVSTKSTPWATAADDALRATRRWDWTVIDYDRVTGRSLQLKTGVRVRAMQTIAKTIGPSSVPMSIAIRAYSRMHDELVRAVIAEPADLIYGGTTGALAAVAEAAAWLGVPYGIDFEDFHSGEHGGRDGDLVNTLANRIERYVIRSATFATAGSPMIADAYRHAHGVRPLAIHNTFSVAPDETAADSSDALRLYWFSQTLGQGRGLDDVVRAAGEAREPIELHLRATPIPQYLDSLRRLQAAAAPNLRLVVHDASEPDDMVRLARAYDAGLSCEEPEVVNKRLCLGNKIFTYLAAGTPVILSRTPAQSALERDLAAAAFGYECGDISGLACVLRSLARDASLRWASRRAAKAAAARRWHWEHPDDRGALLAAVASAA
jgi:glycosyltransferase involved in cell wall biosynthesis